MKRYDLRSYKNDFYSRLEEIIDKEMEINEVSIILFEVIDFSNVEKSASFIKGKGATLMNSIRFNEVDWTLVIKKTSKDNVNA